MNCAQLAVVMSGEFLDQRRTAGAWSCRPDFNLDETRGLGLPLRGAENALSFAGEKRMLYYALVFFIIAIIAAIFGFGGIAAASAGIAKILFIIFLVLFLVSLVAHFGRGSRI